MSKKLLVCVATYNEKDNVERICAKILATVPQCDILFVDDNSPDGTGVILDAISKKEARVKVLHRSCKQGVGSAHQAGIAYAYEHDYDILVTMDCDFTHSPFDIPRLVEELNLCDASIGSRYMQSGSLPGWNLLRRFLTMMGHFLTSRVLGLPHDASGAFRCYHLKKISSELFFLPKSTSYSFFFESLFILRKNGVSIREIPIILPARTYGHSKMTVQDAWRSLHVLFQLFVDDIRTPERFLLERELKCLDPQLIDPQNWDHYWNKPKGKSTFLYGLVAAIYRQGVIKKNLNLFARQTFLGGSRLLHAGCGSGQVDVDLQREMNITALDISPAALRLYSRNNPLAQRLVHGSVFKLPFADTEFDGIYNLGVMEHFTKEEILTTLKEFHRVLADHGKLMLFWPHRWATSVWVLKFIRWVLRVLYPQKEALHPPEITYMHSKRFARQLLNQCGFKLTEYHFGWRDFFVQTVIIAEKSTPTEQK